MCYAEGESIAASVKFLEILFLRTGEPAPYFHGAHIMKKETSAARAIGQHFSFPRTRVSW